MILSLLHSRRRSGEAGKLNEQLEATKVVPLLPFLVFFFFSQHFSLGCLKKVDLDLIVAHLYEKVIKDLGVSENDKEAVKGMGEAEHRLANTKPMRDFVSLFKAKFNGETEKEGKHPKASKKAEKERNQPREKSHHDSDGGESGDDDNDIDEEVCLLDFVFTLSTLTGKPRHRLNGKAYCAQRRAKTARRFKKGLLSWLPRK